jgi:hypothetical protein
LAYEQKDNSGSLFKNDRKEQETHADYRGTIKVAGVDYWLDAWLNESSNGTKYMGLKVKAKDAQGGGSYRTPPTGAANTVGQQSYNATIGGDLDDDVPFATANPALEHRIG